MRTVSHLEENYISPSAPRLNAFNKTFYSEFIKQVSGRDRSKPKKKKKKKKNNKKTTGFRSGFKPQTGLNLMFWFGPICTYFLALKCV